ncbi:hypothetical protein RUM44_003835 [Polyplax serrata]|uniref:Uncharacterized protein n=1 Tax=Polyplax serrata TaxID=468196 RepID=A0ABR1B137_POLSC
MRTSSGEITSSKEPMSGNEDFATGENGNSSHGLLGLLRKKRVISKATRATTLKDPSLGSMVSTRYLMTLHTVVGMTVLE